MVRLIHPRWPRLVPSSRATDPGAVRTAFRLERLLSTAVARFPPLPYCIAVVAVASLARLRYLFDPVLGSQHPFLIFLVAVFLAAWVGGWKPGLLALVLGYVAADLLFIDRAAHWA